MPYTINQNSSDDILLEQSGPKDSNKWNIFNSGRAIPRGPYLQYKYNEKQIKSGNFNRYMDGKTEYIATLTKQRKRSHINKENEDSIQQCIESIKRTQKNTGEPDCWEFFCQDKNNSKPSNMRGGVCIDRIRNQCEPNYIYLKDVIRTKKSGLNETEVWTILSQSVQTLQDLFITSSKPSITFSAAQILPVISPDTLRISSRGRVAFDILTSKDVNTQFICFLSPEYLSYLDKGCEIRESDMEKIWIYSLGITLQQLCTDSNAKNVGHSLSVETTIRSMCAPNPRCRASLMYLLDIISQYCRNGSSKPFSHVAMELFREVIKKLDTEENNLCTSKQPDLFPLAADRLRVKKYPTFIEQSNVTNQHIRLQYLLKNQLYNRNEMPHESPSVNTMNKLASLPDLNKYETLPKPAPLNVRKVLKEKEKDFKKYKHWNVQPGFIPDSNQYKEIQLPTQTYRCQITVLSLRGINYKIRCDVSTKISQILENILTHEQLEENFFLGLCALIGGDFVFLPSKMKVSKIYERINSTDLLVSKKFKKGEIKTITLYLRVKFYLSNIKDISTTSHHLMYLQLRKSILEQQITCTMKDMIVLVGLALQAEIGDYQPNKLVEFNISHYLPVMDKELYIKKNKEFIKYLRNAHIRARGLHPQEAEYRYIQYVQRMEEYGRHLYSAILDTKDQQNVYIAISMNGISILNRPTPKMNVGDANRTEKYELTSSNFRKLYLNFNWIDIENLSFSKQMFSIIVKEPPEMFREGNGKKYRFKMCEKKSFFAFSLASEHHQLHITLKRSTINIERNNYNDLNIPLMVKTEQKNDGNNRNNDGKFFRKFWQRPKSSSDVIAYEKESSIRTTTENFRNECCEQSEYDVNSSFKPLSPNRNRVKMGTRVHSSMNRSYNETNYLDECNKSYISTKYRYLKNLTSSTDTSDSQRKQAFSRSLSVNEYNTDDEQSLRRRLSPEYFNLDSDGVTSSSNKAYVIDSSAGSATDVGLFSLQNESVSETLLDKFINMASTSNNFNDRIITQIVIIKDGSFDQNMRNERKKSAIKKLHPGKSQEQVSCLKRIKQRMNLGISLVQGSDKNIYVKDLVRDSPAERHGITVGDQLLAVNGVSILNFSYEEVVGLLRNTGRIVELTVSQLYQNFENKLKLKAMGFMNTKNYSESMQRARTSLLELTDIKEDLNNYQSDYLKSTRSLPNLLNIIE